MVAVYSLYQRVMAGGVLGGCGCAGFGGLVFLKVVIALLLALVKLAQGLLLFGSKTRFLLTLIDGDSTLATFFRQIVGIHRNLYGIGAILMR